MNNQQKVDRWIREVGIRYFSPLTSLGQLMEEVGEVSRLMIRLYGDQSFKESDRENTLGSELADVLFVICCIANQSGIDLDVELDRVIEKNTVRDMKRHGNNTKL